MKKQQMKKKPAKPKSKSKTKKKLPGYPLYPVSEDIYSNEKKLDDVNPDDGSKIKQENTEPGELNEKDFDDLFTGDDLDIPGAELDDAQEDIGEEDEENNYYSLGGDNHDV
jgi:hypothetical protein